ncbi:hypothetical protein ILYODFUR_022483, partial [Ilyodon furcidens]
LHGVDCVRFFHPSIILRPSTQQLVHRAPLPFPFLPAESGLPLCGGVGSLMDRAVQPLPHPFLLPGFLPKPLPVPQALHGPFPFISAPAHPAVGKTEPRESGLNVNGWPHRSSADWDVNPHISWNLLGGEKQEDEDREGKDAD